MLETPKAKHPKDGKVVWIYGQSAGQGDTMNEDLLYATGLILGDGCLSAVPNKNCSTLHKAVILGSMDLDIVSNFAFIMKENFGTESGITTKENKFFEFRTSKGIVFDFFALNTATKTKFPDCLKGSNKNEKLSFLAGLLDSDGFASFTHSPERLDKKGRVVKARDQFRMGFTNTRFIMELTDLLDQLHIEYGEIWTNNHQTDHIKGRKVGKQLTRFTVPINAMSFAENGGYFKCIRKQSRLIKYLEMMKSCYFKPHRLHAERIMGAMV